MMISPNTPNQVTTIGIGKGGARPVMLEFYGLFHGHPFTSTDLTPASVKRILCIHDAPHSVALFLTQRGTCDMAIHNYIPFAFPGSDRYVVEYTRRYQYPLLITRYGVPVEELLERNGMHKVMARWCTRVYKIEIPRGVYKHFNLAGITQVKGMTRHQSARRSKLQPGMVEDPMAQKSFPLFQELPIFEMTEAEQRELMQAAGIEPFHLIERLGYHGCMLCPYRNEAYYRKLAKEEPILYAMCHAWRKHASARRNTTGQEYWYYPKTKVM